LNFEGSFFCEFFCDLILTSKTTLFYIFILVHLVLLLPSSSISPSAICHQRALSLPQNPNLMNVINNNSNIAIAQSGNASLQSGSSCGAHKTFAIQPVHHRTRSLPLTEETAIDFSQSPPNFARFSSFAAGGVDSKINNSSMDSIIEDYQNMDATNNNSSSCGGGHRTSMNGGGNSILKQLSKIANANLATSTGASSSSPSQLRKKRQHHNVMTAASLRSTYYATELYSHTLNLCARGQQKSTAISCLNLHIQLQMKMHKESE